MLTILLLSLFLHGNLLFLEGSLKEKPSNSTIECIDPIIIKETKTEFLLIVSCPPQLNKDECIIYFELTLPYCGIPILTNAYRIIKEYNNGS